MSWCAMCAICASARLRWVRSSITVSRYCGLPCGSRIGIRVVVDDAGARRSASRRMLVEELRCRWCVATAWSRDGDLVGHLLREDVVRGLADHLLARDAEVLLAGAVDQDVAQVVRVLHDDRRRHVLDHRVGEGLAAVALLSARRRSVMSSCVTTQPVPSGVGWLMTAMMRPSVSSIVVDGRLALASSPPAARRCSASGSTAKNVPVAMRAWTRSWMRAAGLHDIGRQPVHLQIALVADHQPARRIEHVEALRHVVEGGVELQLLLAQLAFRRSRSLGDVVVRRHPAAAVHRLVVDRDDPAVRQLRDEVEVACPRPAPPGAR